MKIRLTLLAALLVALTGCAAPRTETAHAAWNGGVWNSTLGYHGPTNTMGPVGAK